MTSKQGDDDRTSWRTGEEIEALNGDTGGRWLVTTQSSEHVWDLDAMTYRRMPGLESRSGVFAYDSVDHRISRVDAWPRVGGQSVVYYDDPSHPRLAEQYRISSTIKSIERLTRAEEE